MDSHHSTLRGRRDNAFTLLEVVVAMALAVILATAAFSTITVLSRRTMDNLYTSEAHRIAQQHIESLMGGPWASFTASSAVSIDSTVETTTRRSALSRFAYSADPAAPLVFTRDVSLVSGANPTQPFTHLRVRVQWTFLQQPRSVVISICKAQPPRS